MLGVVTGRAVKAPEDRAAWLRSIANGLSTRGFTGAFDKTAAEGPHSVVVGIRLITAWVADTAMNKDANVALHVVAEHPGSPPLAGDYRGALSTLNWRGSVSELRDLVDRAFAKALDGLSPDLHRLFGS